MGPYEKFMRVESKKEADFLCSALIRMQTQVKRWGWVLVGKPAHARTHTHCQHREVHAQNQRLGIHRYNKRPSAVVINLT